MQKSEDPSNYPPMWCDECDTVLITPDNDEGHYYTQSGTVLPLEARNYDYVVILFTLCYKCEQITIRQLQRSTLKR